MQLTDVMSWVAMATFIGIIWQHLNIGSRAYIAARQATERSGVVLLDQSVILQRLRVVRSSHSLFAVERCYKFEFSSIGDRRYKGWVKFRGNRLVGTDLEPYKTQEPEPLAPLNS